MTTSRALLYTAYTVSASSQLAFGMVIPQLPRYLEASGLVTAATLGAVLGVRVISHRVGGVLGGGLADRLGFRITIAIGIVVRTAGLGILAFSATVTGLVVGLCLIGLGGALFGPGLNLVYGSSGSTAAQRETAFRWGNAFDTIGSITGPLLGALLLGLGFTWLCLSSALVYLLIGVVFLAGLRRLPDRQPVNTATKPLTGIFQPWHDSRWWLAFPAILPFFLLSQQNYVIVSLDLIRLGSEETIPYMFAANAAVVFGVSQLLSRPTVHQRLTVTGKAVTAGYLVLTGGAILAVLLPGTPTTLLYSAALSTASILIEPAFRSRVYTFAPDGLQGTYFGASGLLMGTIAFTGSWLGGWLADLTTHHRLPLTWLTLLACAAIGIRLAHRPQPRGYIIQEA